MFEFDFTLSGKQAYGEIWKYDVYDFPAGASGWVVDVGANIGVFSLYAREKSPKCRVLAIEPHPDNLTRLYGHIERNNVDGIVVEPLAVGATTGDYEIRGKHGNAGARSFDAAHPLKGAQRIQGDTLANIMSRHGIAEGTFLKVDVEGYEQPVLSTIDINVFERIGVECHGLANFEFVYSLLQDNGFTVSKYESVLRGRK